MAKKTAQKILVITILTIALVWPQASLFAVTKSKIGDVCFDGVDNDDCELGGADLDCEESDKKDGSGNNLKYCTTNSDEDCQNAYGTEIPGQWKRSSGADYTYDLAYCYNDSVSPVAVRTAASVNKKASPIGKLADAVFDSPAARAALLEEVKTFKPMIEIRLPGMEFSDLAKTVGADGYLYIPWIGEFLKAVYNFGLVIISIVAVVMIIIAGTKIVVSGGESKVESYKKIGQIAVGLVIAWGSYAILYTINPALVEFNSLKVKYIEKKPLDFEDNSPDTGAVSSDSGVSYAKIGGTAAGALFRGDGGRVIEKLLNSSSPKSCSVGSANDTAQKLHDLSICVGPCHCAYTAGNFLNYIGCTDIFSGSAAWLGVGLDNAGWNSYDLTEVKDPVPLGLLWRWGHVGISLGNGYQFQSGGGVRFSRVAGKCPLRFAASQKEPSLCQTCSKISGEGPADKSNGCDGNQGWTKDKVDVKNWSMIITPAKLDYLTPSLKVDCLVTASGLSKKISISKDLCDYITAAMSGGKKPINDT